MLNRLVRPLLVVTLVAAAPLAVVISATPAHACYCIEPQTMEAAKGASAIFIGTLTAIPRQAQAPAHDRSILEFTVERSLKGDVTPVQLVSAPAMGNCTLRPLQVGTLYAVYARTDAGDFILDVCSRVVELTPEQAELEAATVRLSLSEIADPPARTPPHPGLIADADDLVLSQDDGSLPSTAIALIAAVTALMRASLLALTGRRR